MAHDLCYLMLDYLLTAAFRFYPKSNPLVNGINQTSCPRKNPLLDDLRKVPVNFFCRKAGFHVTPPQTSLDLAA